MPDLGTENAAFFLPYLHQPFVMETNDGDAYDCVRDASSATVPRAEMDCCDAFGILWRERDCAGPGRTTLPLQAGRDRSPAPRSDA